MKFTVLFCIPAKTMQDWMANVDEAERKRQTDEMMQGWQKWMDEHKDHVHDQGLPLGKTKQVTRSGIADARNDFNYLLIVEADSHDAAARMFENHPHLDIPDAYIQVMDSSLMPGM